MFKPQCVESEEGQCLSAHVFISGWWSREARTEFVGDTKVGGTGNVLEERLRIKDCDKLERRSKKTEHVLCPVW